jgi:very-short-patch-repair endonuclease
MNKEEILKRLNNVHGNKYDFSKITDSKTSEKVTSICPIHGEFQTRLGHLLRGCGCPTCSGKQRKTFEQFVKDAEIVHKGRYKYNDNNYVNAHTEIKITCPIHGDFSQTPTNHLNGNGCPKCKLEKLSQMFASNTEEFIEKANIVHNNEYIYDKTDYKNNRTEVIITCPKHGDFKQTPQGHLSGRGCPYCRQSKLEKSVKKLLDNNNIEYKYQWHLPWSKYYSLDFYLPQINVGIECQGIQHFEDGRFKKTTLKEIQERDTFKLKTCQQHQLPILYFSNIEGHDCITDEKILLEKIENMLKNLDNTK